MPSQEDGSQEEKKPGCKEKALQPVIAGVGWVAQLDNREEKRSEVRNPCGEKERPEG